MRPAKWTTERARKIWWSLWQRHWLVLGNVVVARRGAPVEATRLAPLNSNHTAQRSRP